MSLIDTARIPLALSAGVSGHVAMHETLHDWTRVFNRCVRILNVKPGSDITAALQGAIDAVQANSTGSAYPALLLPPGDYRLSDTITVKSASIIGGGFFGMGARLFWDGAPDKAALVKDETVPGGMSWWECANLRFRPGTAEPVCWLNLANTEEVDVGLRLHDLHFEGGVNAIQVNSWINCHWHDLRFDNQSGYCLTLAPRIDQHLSSFRLDGFTWDHRRTDDKPGKGFMLLDLRAEPSNAGIIRVQSGRMEINTPLDAPTGIFVYQHSAGEPTVMGDSTGLHVSDVCMQNCVGMEGLHMLYRNAPASVSGGECWIFENVRYGRFDGFLGGTWPDNQTDILGLEWGNITHHAQHGTGIV